jgi:hypothetical protein
MIFATPDFGASAGISCCVFFVWAVVLVGVSFGIGWGVRLLKNQSLKVRRAGLLLVVASGLVPFLCCFGPPQVIRLVYGNYPIGSYPSNKINEGISEDEVLEILGRPHERIKRGDDGERWYYWIDSFGISWVCVRFGPEGRVTGTHGN